MAYARFSEGDVYLFGNVHGYFECCACRLAAKVPSIMTKGRDSLGIPPCDQCEAQGCDDCMIHDNTKMKSRSECLEHLERHRQAGHKFPEQAVERLKEEIVEGEDEFGDPLV